MLPSAGVLARRETSVRESHAWYNVK